MVLGLPLPPLNWKDNERRLGLECRRFGHRSKWRFRQSHRYHHKGFRSKEAMVHTLVI
mgnify:CR=1 FL=1